MGNLLRWVVIIELFTLTLLSARLWGRDIAMCSWPAFWKGLIDCTTYVVIAIAVFWNVLQDTPIAPGVKILAWGFAGIIVAKLAVTYLWRQPQGRHRSNGDDCDCPPPGA